MAGRAGPRVQRYLAPISSGSQCAGQPHAGPPRAINPPGTGFSCFKDNWCKREFAAAMSFLVPPPRTPNLAIQGLSA